MSVLSSVLSCLCVCISSEYVNAFNGPTIDLVYVCLYSAGRRYITLSSYARLPVRRLHPSMSDCLPITEMLLFVVLSTIGLMVGAFRLV